MKLLLIDDHRLFRDGMVMLLEKLASNSEIIQTADGHEALSYFNQDDIDLAIVDYQLPDLSGVELLKQIKQLSPATPVVIMSGLEDTHIVRDALTHGASGFLPKILEPEEIIDALRLVLEGGFYVPPFVIKKIHSQPKINPQDQELADLAEMAKKLIRDNHWEHSSNDQSKAIASLSNGFTALHNERKQLQRYAFYDHLTDLPNRRLFQERLLHAQKNAHRKRQNIAIIALDLDKFKQVNDVYGHNCGDQLLQTIAQRLLRCIREVDTAARLGGDEFMVILNEVTDRQSILIVIERMLALLKQPMNYQGQVIDPLVSLGIAIDCGNKASHDLIDSADKALYRAKSDTQVHYCFAD